MRNIINGKLLIICYAIFLSFTGCSSYNKNIRNPEAFRGVIDLRNWDFDRNPSIELQGKWGYYRNIFLRPTGQGTNFPEPTGYIRVPKHGTARLLEMKN